MLVLDLGGGKDMRVLVLGGSGMLGHKLWQRCRGRFDTWVSVRGVPERYASMGLFDCDRVLGGVDATNWRSVVSALDSVQPEVVVNCVGIVKQLPAAKDPVLSIGVNSLLPHRLAQWAKGTGARLVHISTDCVFSGRKGMYLESDASDADDLYGRTKLLGEVTAPGCLTLRTSMIGRELGGAHGLVEWFLAQAGTAVQGYTRAVFSGLTTLALADAISDVIARHPDLTGLYHVAAQPVDKRQLLCMLRDSYDLSIDIIPDAEVSCDRSLNGDRFRTATGFVAPSWPDMVAAMAADPTPYNEWRQASAS
ncbi:MAG: dTDP-4-dehydrorhamnose reductase family protein [Anaerolineae bacterium]